MSISDFKDNYAPLLSLQVIRSRIFNHGWTTNEIVSKQKLGIRKVQRKFAFIGEMMSFTDFCEKYLQNEGFESSLKRRLWRTKVYNKEINKIFKKPLVRRDSKQYKSIQLLDLTKENTLIGESMAGFIKIETFNYLSEKDLLGANKELRLQFEQRYKEIFN